MRAVLLMLVVLLLAACAAPPHAVDDFALQTPRPFGYLNGDEIRHRIVFRTHNGVRLQQAGLPKQGTLNRWLNLNAIHVQEAADDGGFRYRIDLTYQVFYAPLEVKMLTVPGFDLSLAQGANAAVQAVPPWHFTLSPLRELAIRKDAQGQYPRPNAVPRVAAAHWALPALAGGGLAFALSAAYLGYRYGFLPGLPPRRVFKVAARALAGLAPEQFGEALTLFHLALNTLHGAPLFAAQLDELPPTYRAVSDELAWFFRRSDQYFFAGCQTAAADDWARLKRLCARCRELEQVGG